MKKLVTTCMLAVCTAALLYGCKKKTKGNPVPEIFFQDLTPASLRGGSSEDTLYLSFRFTDGDADLGNDPVSGIFDIYLKDSRDSAEIGYFFPQIPEAVADPAEGLSGTCTLILPGAFILPRQDSLHLTLGDTLAYEVYIRDRAGHESNRFTTPAIYLTP